MNDEIREIKARLRRLDELLGIQSGTAMSEQLEFAQALSQARRLLRRTDRKREPTPELRASVGRAEALSARVR